MSIERTATAICDVCADEEVMGTRPFDEIPDGWAWLDLIGKKVRLLCPVCAGIIYSGGWPEGKTAVSPSAIELADEYGGFADGEWATPAYTNDEWAAIRELRKWAVEIGYERTDELPYNIRETLPPEMKMAVGYMEALKEVIYFIAAQLEDLAAAAGEE